MLQEPEKFLKKSFNLQQNFDEISQEVESRFEFSWFKVFR